MLEQINFSSLSKCAHRQASEHVSSYYAASANPSPLRNTLTSNAKTDICIIGGGYTGLSSALYLLEEGFRVTILEAAKVGWGASGRNGGQIVNSYSRDIDVLEKIVGKKQAILFGTMAFEGSKIIRDRITQYGIQCDLKDGGVFAALNNKQLQKITQQKALWERYGYNQLEMLSQSDMKNIVNSDIYVGGLLDKSGGHIHPLNLALGEATAVENLGGKIYERSAVIRIEHGDPVKVFTNKGSVTAAFLVLAGNAYLGGLVPELKAKSMPCGTQVIATEPLSDKQAKSILPQDYCVEDCNYLLNYYRLSGDKRLIYGGGVAYGALNPSGINAMIRPKMLKTFPQLDNIKIHYSWTGNFLMTLSRFPQVGRIGNNIYYSQGCSGHGVTYTHLFGRLMSEVLKGQTERFNAFAGLPHLPFPGGHMFRVPFSMLGAWYYTVRDKLGI
ncbi:NAD(P)/FAD-dependent oxidoreductase [Candidatus Enterovibrio altilux]|uniref:Gamma-glutamyl-putrescine oxidase n=1 Tax=Candidatus Enterovibrio altilux TaxID=1927128 RepID=A0A291B7E1_9GAMM|nr:FAD-binding oxidoreductase [Candidatus Enterovibrio luxaltus]ATF08918.1 Gamma-glutamyl-putrescine oxidase [Candidatus Enterovibrio luxaltus]